MLLILIRNAPRKLKTLLMSTPRKRGIVLKARLTLAPKRLSVPITSTKSHRWVVIWEVAEALDPCSHPLQGTKEVEASRSEVVAVSQIGLLQAVCEKTVVTLTTLAKHLSKVLLSIQPVRILSNNNRCKTASKKLLVPAKETNATCQPSNDLMSLKISVK